MKNKMKIALAGSMVLILIANCVPIATSVPNIETDVVTLDKNINEDNEESDCGCPLAVEKKGEEQTTDGTSSTGFWLCYGECYERWGGFGSELFFFLCMKDCLENR